MAFTKPLTEQSKDQVNAIALCRGDVNVASCRQCIYRSTFVLQKRCPNQKEAVIWYDNCMLRYSNRYFFGNMEFGPWFWMYNLKKVPNPGAFTRAVRSLLNTLIFKAASGSSCLSMQQDLPRETLQIYTHLCSVVLTCLSRVALRA